MPNRFSFRIRAKQLSPQLPLCRRQTDNWGTEKIKTLFNEDSIDNFQAPEPSNPTKEKPRKKNFLPPKLKTKTTTIKTTKAVETRFRRQQNNRNLTTSEEKILKLL